MYERQLPNLSRVLESLSDLVAAALRILTPKPPTTAFVELYKLMQVLRSRPCAETSASLDMKKRCAIFGASLFWFRNSGLISITVLRPRSSI